MLQKNDYGWRGADAARNVIIVQLWSEVVPQRLWESTVGVKENLPLRRQPASRQQDKPEDLPGGFRGERHGRIEVSKALWHVSCWKFLDIRWDWLEDANQPRSDSTGSVR